MAYDMEEINENLKGFATTIKKITELREALMKNIKTLESIQSTLGENNNIKETLNETQKNLNAELTQIQRMFTETHEKNLNEFKSKTDDRFNDIISALDRVKDNINDHLRVFSETLKSFGEENDKLNAQIETHMRNINESLKSIQHDTVDLKYLKPGLVTLLVLNLLAIVFMIMMLL